MIKFLGGVFLMIGAVIGGGILAIPIVSAKFGFLTTEIFIILSWMIMTKTGLYVLELSLSCPEKYNSYYSIVGKFLGRKIQCISIFLFLWLLYFSLASCISGCISIILGFIEKLPAIRTYASYTSVGVLYMLIFGSLITISSKVIIRINGLIVTLKLGLLLATIIFAYSLSSQSQLIYNVSFQHVGILSLSLVIVNTFGFQFIVPSLVSYYGRENKNIFRAMLVTSTTSVLVLYTAWLYVIYMVIPSGGDHGLVSINGSENQLMALNTSLQYYLHSKVIETFLSGFEAVAIFGSFICISLGLLDYFVDLFKTERRVIIGSAAFIPPLVLSLCSQNMYIQAMSAAGYIAIILEILIPVWAKRKQISCDRFTQSAQICQFRQI